jgi:hypothetical protein
VENFGSLKIHSPEFFPGVLQLQAKLPASTSFMPTPYQDRAHRILVDQIDQPQFLSNRKPCGTIARHPFGPTSTVQPVTECRALASSHSTEIGTRELTRAPARTCFILSEKLCSFAVSTRFS